MKKRILLIVLIGMSFGMNAQEKIQTEIGLKNDFIYKNGKVGIGTTNPDQGIAPDLQRKLLVNGGITLKSGGKLSYDPNYYVHAYSEYNSSISEARFLNYGYYGHRWETRAGIGMVMLGNNGKVGIGTTNPGGGTAASGSLKLQINGDLAVNSGYMLSVDHNYQSHGYLKFDSALPKARFKSYGYYGHRFDDNGDTRMVIQQGGRVGIGTTTPDAKLSVNGKIHTKEVKVDLIGWSDFVFYDDYKLPTLLEVENHIKENGHLKDIPSAKDVKENGIYLGEMDSKLLQKIEELTLYTNLTIIYV